MPTSPLAGTRIVLIGGTEGIGLATAQAAAELDADVIVVSSRQENVEKALTELPDSAEGRTVDVRDESAVKALFNEIGPFDHLVFTAGNTMKVAPVLETELETVKHFFDVRFWGAYSSVKQAAPHIRPGGSIVLSSGGSSQRPGPGWAVAASALGAMEALNRALAVELAPIRVNLVRPGMTRTDMWREFPEDTLQEMSRSTGEALPVGRIGETQDIARSYIHLMEQAYATGTILNVDGGGYLV